MKTIINESQAELSDHIEPSLNPMKSIVIHQSTVVDDQPTLLTDKNRRPCPSNTLLYMTSFGSYYDN